MKEGEAAREVRCEKVKYIPSPPLSKALLL